ERGVNFFDNAEVYAQGESEVIMGKSLKRLSWDRDTYMVSSKVFWGGKLPTQRGLNRKHLVEACHNALDRLQVEYLDLYFCHRPDPDTPMEEIVTTMNHLMAQGKIFYWGTSEWSADQIMEAHAVARDLRLVGPTMEQPQYNLFHRQKVEKDYKRVFETVGIGTTIWSPLASGILTGKYNKSIPKGSRMSLEDFSWLKDQLESEEGQDKVRKAIELEKLAQDIGLSLTQLSLSWCLLNPNVSTVILGASKTTQLEENLSSLECVDKITPEIIEKIEDIVQNCPVQEKDWKA
ncbi:MAG: aldo/keto reductase, partial [Bdellovibrionales bacterium]|nr:aldo/keto reductase [Bdellovibrionales bacterium]